MRIGFIRTKELPTGEPDNMSISLAKVQSVKNSLLALIVCLCGFPANAWSQYQLPWPGPGDSIVTTHPLVYPPSNLKKRTYFLKQPDEIAFEAKAFLAALGNGKASTKPSQPGEWVACYGTSFVRRGGPVQVSEAWWVNEVADNGIEDEMLLRNRFWRDCANGGKVVGQRDMSRAQRGHSFGYFVRLPAEKQLQKGVERLNAIDLALQAGVGERQREKLQGEREELERMAHPALMARWYALEREAWQQAYTPGEWVPPKKLPLYTLGSPWDSLETEDIFQKMVLPAKLNYRYQLKAVYVVERDRKGKVLGTETHIRAYDQDSEPLANFWTRKFGEANAKQQLHFFRNELTIVVVERQKVGKVRREIRTHYHLTRKNKISE